MDNISSFVC
uniref:Uncharacterized protein n=1 Tax=Arundo donax TaxID=35708 RepID=A0A0A8ZG73_ARUDO